MELNWKAEGTRKRFQEAIWAITGNMPAIEMVEAYMDTDDNTLQDFCCTHQRATWMTGIGIIDAAYLIVDEAFGNANIDDEGNVR